MYKDSQPTIHVIIKKDTWDIINKYTKGNFNIIINKNVR
jgi:hypothetical protein